MFWGAAKGVGKIGGLTYGAVEILFDHFPRGSCGKIFLPTDHMELENK